MKPLCCIIKIMNKCPYESINEGKLKIREFKQQLDWIQQKHQSLLQLLEEQQISLLMEEILKWQRQLIEEVACYKHIIGTLENRRDIKRIPLFESCPYEKELCSGRDFLQKQYLHSLEQRLEKQLQEHHEVYQLITKALREHTAKGRKRESCYLSFKPEMQDYLFYIDRGQKSLKEQQVYQMKLFRRKMPPSSIKSIEGEFSIFYNSHLLDRTYMRVSSSYTGLQISLKEELKPLEIIIVFTELERFYLKYKDSTEQFFIIYMNMEGVLKKEKEELRRLSKPLNIQFLGQVNAQGKFKEEQWMIKYHR